MTTKLNDAPQVYFMLMVNGRPASARFSDRVAAEMARSSLPADQQNLAEVVTVDASGRQLLLG